MAKPVNITDAEFEQQVLQSDVPVVVDFWAPWCGPCRAVAPILEELAAEYEGKVKVTKINTDEDQQWAARFGITGIPTMLFFKNGELVNQVIGARPKSQIKAQFEAVLAE
ncbi:MAG: thioredoxin [Chloroflexota bacterium]